MWLLTNIVTGGVLIVIREKSKYAIGRVGADLVISDDSSISRTHAFLHITTQTENSDAQKENELLELEDAGSKYGTFHNDGINNGTGIPKQKKIILSEGDRIRFGVLKSVWTVSNPTPQVAISVLPSAHTQMLKQYMEVLGGCVLGGWNEKYTHLTLAEINMTSKLLHALLDQKPIVTCDYWCNVVQAARRGRRSMPQITSFLPPNPNNIDLTYRADRHHLFKNLTFVFLHAHHFKTYAPIVEKAGGKSKHLNEGIQKSFLVRKDVVVVQYVPCTESQSSQTINTIEDCLKLHSRRTVPEFEIGLAIVQCSTEKFCNPRYHPDDDLDQDFKLSKVRQSQNCNKDASFLTNNCVTLDGEATEVFIPETDRKTIPSTNLTNQTTGSTDSRVEPTPSTADSLEPRRDADIITHESQILDAEKKTSADVSISALQVSESVHEATKRKRSEKEPTETARTLGSHMDSDDDELFDFAAKKAHLDNKSSSISPVERVMGQQRKSSPQTTNGNEESATTSAATTAKQTKTSSKQLPIEVNKRKTKRTVINMSGFLEKSQTPFAANTDASERSELIENEIRKHGTKRARNAVIDNSDDDDLFCFGGKNDDSNHMAKRSRTRSDTGGDSDEDLFNFGGAANNEKDDNYSKDLIDADEATKVAEKTKNNRRNAIVMPKPKQLPAKICITAAWLDCSLSALSIKAEEVKKEEKNLETKRENNDSGVEGDSKDTIEPIKGGCIVTMLNTKSLLNERELSRKIKSGTRDELDNTNSYRNSKNFKKFTKKFQPQNRRVIRTVPSTVCGSLI